MHTVPGDLVTNNAAVVDSIDFCLWKPRQSNTSRADNDASLVFYVLGHLAQFERSVMHNKFNSEALGMT